MKLSGAVAEIKCGWLLAAELRQWSLEDSGAGGQLTATCIKTDAFRLGQSPLSFVVHAHGTVWRWPVQSHQLVNGDLTASVGPREG